MRKKIIYSFLVLFALGFYAKADNIGKVQQGYCKYVNPFVGTLGEGNTYPGAQVPFGMVQVSPDTEKWKWGAASGYEYSDSTIYGFSMLHLHGTGIPDMGDILFMPTVGKVQLESGKKDRSEPGYLSGFSHNNECAFPGYYSVLLDDYKVKAELTATNRAGMMRFTYPESDSAHVLLDLKHVLRHNVVWSNVRVVDDCTIVGMHQVKGWARERYVYFAAKFSKPFKQAHIFSDKKEVKYDSYKTYRFRSSKDVAGTDIQLVADYSTKEGEQISVKVGISAVSTANAMDNLTNEIPNWNFEHIVEDAQVKWNAELSKFDVEGTQEQKETFYTAVYHEFMAPVRFADYNGSYRGLDQNIYKEGKNKNYTLFSLWDTYRATHPLFCLVQADRNSDMINSMLAHYEQSADSLLPIWSFWNNETWCMIGYHAVPVIVDAYFKGIQGVDWEKALEACVSSATHPEFDALPSYEKLGYVPYDEENESVSKTLEYAYDDYCIAMMAKDMGQKAIYDRFIKRAMAYENLFDTSINWMRPKDSKGEWMPDFDTRFFKHMGAFTEGTTWQYSWYVPQDVQGLVNLMGGPKDFEVKLDSVFTTKKGKDYKGVDDIHGRIGEYWHGNEPSHHITYLYNYIGKPWKGQKLIHQVINSQYGNQPGSLCGNDDCGQMSAWYIFSAMGFYPVCPGTNDYVIGSPALPKITMNMSNGKSLKMRCENYAPKNIYVQSVSLNGEKWTKSWFSYDEIKDGGEIVFKMGDHPNKSWGKNRKAYPPSISK
ncbi:glycoside hydrolase family 92 protein [Puteibacter caeruleilacunae]|nr:glycoside hydrolase family 92 protein [Puteibacter caeruleilacunae]